MSTLEPFASTPEAIAAVLAQAEFELPHASLEQLPAPHYLIHADSTLSELVLTTGTVVVTGSLTVTGPVDLHQIGRPIAHVIVLGDCALGLAYVDGFWVVRGDLRVGTLIADSNWSGGVFVGGDLAGHTLVVKDVGVEVDGRQHVEKVADFDDLDAARVAVPALFEHSEDPRSLYIALRDSSDPLVPAHPVHPAPSAPARAPAASKASAKSRVPRSARSKSRAKPASKSSTTKSSTSKLKPTKTKPTKTKPTKTKKPAKTKPTKTKKPAKRR